MASGLSATLLALPLDQVRSAGATLDAGERARVAAGWIRLLEDGKRSLEERLRASRALAALGDPRIDALAPSMIPVPAGRFRMGMPAEAVPAVAREFDLPEAWLETAVPQHEQELGAFEIARFPVTQGEWARFVDETGHPERPACWRGGHPPAGWESDPVWDVSWEAVLAYCDWLSRCTGLRYRVPTEAEWERAARGLDARAYPWGEHFDPLRANTRETGIGGTTPVGLFTEGASSVGALDMAGNVEEYTASLLVPYPGASFVPERPADRVTRGGCFRLDGDLARCDRRHARRHGGAVGFRLARSRARLEEESG